jgi:CheY-like chemotaxis protein
MKSGQMFSILVVDDELAIREFLSDLFQDMGHQVYEAGTGIDAVSIIKQHGKPDLLLTDLMMPLMGGQELLAWIRSTKALQNLPAVLMTAANDRIIQEQVPQTVVIHKPFDIDHVESVITKLLFRVVEPVTPSFNIA